jgi:hypothetical protein
MRNIFYKIRKLSYTAMVSAGLGCIFSTAALAQDLDALDLVDTNTGEWKELTDFIYGPRGVYLDDSGQVVAPLRSTGNYALTGPDGVGILNSNLHAQTITGINAAGQVVGRLDFHGFYSGFISEPDGVGFTPIDGLITGVNDGGQTVGYNEIGAFITGANGHDLTYLYTLGLNTIPSAINASGQVVGTYASDPGIGAQPFITGPAGANMTKLDSPADFYDVGVAGINASGQLALNFENILNTSHGFITGPNGIGLTDIGSLNGTYTYTTGINDAGQVVGVSGNHAFITGPNGIGMTDLAP